MEKINVSVTRDSVCMGDDISAPHKMEFSVSNNSEVEEIFQILKDKNYLAMVNGTLHSWTAKIFDNPVAKVSGDSRIAVFKSGISEQSKSYVIEGNMKIHFEYHASKI